MNAPPFVNVILSASLCTLFQVCTQMAIAPVDAADPPRSGTLNQQWVAFDGTGKLEYKTTPKGDHIMDFSHAGYMGGGVAIPLLPVKSEIAPSGGDDTAAIQAAIDAVSTLPLENGLRGAVLLKPGTFHCANGLVIRQHGVVMRGSGPGKDGTLIEMTGEPHTAFIIEGPDLSFPKATPANTYPIADAYVPAGAGCLSVRDATGLAAGDAIRIRWGRTEKWIRFMGMDELVRKRNGKPDSPQTWIKENETVTIHRNIRSIQGHCLTLDVPLTDTIDAQFLEQDPAVVVKTPPAKRLSQCGIESLQIVSPPHSGTLTAGKYISVALKGDSEDCWVKDIIMRETLNNVQVCEGCRRITITEAHSYHDSSVEKGAGYPADISLRGSQVLVDRCTSHGLGGFYVATLNQSARLNVVLHCTFEGEGGIQPHMHWSTGLLIDSCTIPDGRIDLINRHSSGSGHGWAIGWGIAWNCTVKHLQIQSPPGALNLAIGCLGEPHKTFNPEAFFSANQPVTPASRLCPVKWCKSVGGVGWFQGGVGKLTRRDGRQGARGPLAAPAPYRAGAVPAAGDHPLARHAAFAALRSSRTGARASASRSMLSALMYRSPAQVR